MNAESIVIRNERKEDYRTVEELTREAFWNVYMPGCDEHYLVHVMRASADFIPELDLVAVLDGRIVGNIMFTRSFVVGGQDRRHDTITFGPVGVLPEYHGRGIGSALIGHARDKAASIGHRAILIYGDPGYYNRLGFRSAKEYGIGNPDGVFPEAHLALELYDGSLHNMAGRAFESGVYHHIDPKEVEAFDRTFPHKEKRVTESQKKFNRMRESFL